VDILVSASKVFLSFASTSFLLLYYTSCRPHTAVHQDIERVIRMEILGSKSKYGMQRACEGWKDLGGHCANDNCFKVSRGSRGMKDNGLIGRVLID
jgi:hypothetical protein